MAECTEKQSIRYFGGLVTVTRPRKVGIPSGMQRYVTPVIELIDQKCFIGLTQRVFIHFSQSKDGRK